MKRFFEDGAGRGGQTRVYVASKGGGGGRKNHYHPNKPYKGGEMNHYHPNKPYKGVFIIEEDEGSNDGVVSVWIDAKSILPSPI